MTSAADPGIGQRAAAAAQKVLDGQWCFQLAGSDVQVIRAALPGRARVSVVNTDGVLSIILDDGDLHEASRHLCDLLRTWPADLDRDPALDEVGELFCTTRTPEPRRLIRRDPDVVA